MEKNLIFASSAIRQSRNNLKFKKKDIIQRENDYFFCLQQLQRVVPSNFDIYIVDNSLDSLNSLLNQDLKLLLNTMNIELTYKPNTPEVKNIGVAELKQLFHLENIIDFKKYSKICYFSSRRFITNPYVFEKTERLNENALIANPDFTYLDGRILKSQKKGMYNDMFFAMKNKTMMDYIEYSKERIEYLDVNMINSERNLFNFITENNISYEFINYFGFLRYDYFTKKKWYHLGKKNDLLSNYHFV